MTLSRTDVSVNLGLQRGGAGGKVDKAAVVILRTAVQARLEVRCAECGYGVAIRVPPERCPMCGGTVWSQFESRRLNRRQRATL
jgi:rubredoxin